jgi:hypothetical protein
VTASSDDPVMKITADRHGLIYQIEPDVDHPRTKADARIHAKQVMRELEQMDPAFAAMGKKHRREMREWRKRRRELAERIALLQTPFFAAAVFAEDDAVQDCCLGVLTITDWMVDQDAPDDLFDKFFAIAKRVLPP